MDLDKNIILQKIQSKILYYVGGNEPMDLHLKKQVWLLSDGKINRFKDKHNNLEETWLWNDLYWNAPMWVYEYILENLTKIENEYYEQ